MSEPKREARAVYVIDDNARVRAALQRLLTLHNWPVRTFETAEAFLAEVGAMPSGCIVMDVKLPGMNGLDLIRRLTAIGSTLPIIVISGSRRDDAESEALRLGARAYLDKPFDPQVLFQAISQALA